MGPDEATQATSLIVFAQPQGKMKLKIADIFERERHHQEKKILTRRDEEKEATSPNVFAQPRGKIKQKRADIFKREGHN